MMDSKTFDIELKGLSPMAVLALHGALREIVSTMARGNSAPEGVDYIQEIVTLLKQMENDLVNAAQVIKHEQEVPKIALAQFAPTNQPN
jgi:hypothetical protein